VSRALYTPAVRLQAGGMRADGQVLVHSYESLTRPPVNAIMSRPPGLGHLRVRRLMP
jgi:hypothetical protein